MIENRLFFLCEPCGAAVPIAARGRGPYVTPRKADFNAWFRKHARCGDNYDHFSVVYGVEPDGNTEVVIATPEDQGKVIADRAQDEAAEEPRH